MIYYITTHYLRDNRLTVMKGLPGLLHVNAAH